MPWVSGWNCFCCRVLRRFCCGALWRRGHLEEANKANRHVLATSSMRQAWRHTLLHQPTQQGDSYSKERLQMSVTVERGMSSQESSSQRKKRKAETIVKLDSRSVFSVGWNARFQEFLKTQGVKTFGDLRRASTEWFAEVPPGVGFGQATRSLVRLRLSESILCNCGCALILYDDGVICESPKVSCGKVQRYPPCGKSQLRRAFPERISK